MKSLLRAGFGGIATPSRTARHAVRAAVLLLSLAGSHVAVAEENEVRAIVEANFEAADADGSGSLDASEFRALIDANAGHQIGRAAMVRRFGAYDRAFGRADRDGDGSVAWSEIVNNAREQAE